MDWNKLPLRERLLDWGCSFASKVEAITVQLRNRHITSLETAQEQLRAMDGYRRDLINLIESWRSSDDEYDTDREEEDV